jgi:hybrid cluster-associated redox disulfide protein
MARITSNMTFNEILRSHPDAPGVLTGFNLGCVGCMGAQHETLEQGAMAHGLDPEVLLEALNKLFEE